MQIKEMLFIFLLIFIIQLPILIIINFSRKRRLLMNIRVLAVIAYVIVIISLTLWPPVLNQPSLSWAQISFNLIPFKSIIGSLNHFYYMVGIRNVLGNFVLLFPLAFLLKIKNTRNVILYGLLISLSIEVIQMLLTITGLIRSRSFDIDDIILNSTGFYFGYVMRKIFIKLYQKKRFSRVTQGGNGFISPHRRGREDTQ